jgi:hypothetical protein
MSERVERSVRLATVLPTIEAAFAFVIAAIDGEHLDEPRIVISPMLRFVEGDDEPERLYEVEVQGEPMNGTSR